LYKNSIITLTFREEHECYTIDILDEDYKGLIMLSNQNGEAMEIDKKEIFDIIDRYFKERF